MKNIIFLDVDGVLNCQLFYDKYFAHLERFNGIPFYKTCKKFLRRLHNVRGRIKDCDILDFDYYKSQMDPDRIELLNKLCVEVDAGVVISASMRSGKTIEQLQEIFNHCGATFTIIGKTGHCDCRTRGCEIKKWLYDNITEQEYGCKGFDFYRYAIIDDDSDMLLGQAPNFFQVDNYSGLTPTICYKIKRFLIHKTF
jgi:hypothetical protein